MNPSTLCEKIASNGIDSLGAVIHMYVYTWRINHASHVGVPGFEH